MGFLKNLFGQLNNNTSFSDIDQNFINLVRANENGEEWAKQQIRQMWESNDSSLVPRISRAWTVIYKDAAYAGDREAIIKYARGLEWCDRQDEALQWYMKLIDNGDTDAMLELAHDYTQYGGMGENPQEELKWILLSAKAGNADAQAQAGTELLIQGDRFTSAEWFRRSAEQGNPEGKLGYARVLSEHMQAISEYSSGLDEISPGRYDCLSQYHISKGEDCKQILEDLYSEIEQLYIDVLNNSRNESSLTAAHMELANLYIRPPKNSYPADPYRAAFFQYMCSYYFDHSYARQQFQRIISENSLTISPLDMQEWEKGRDFDDWADEHKIYD